MHSSLTELFHGWHDFFLLLGTASATLVGLMFVAASIGTSIFKEENRPALEVFLGPTIVHFTSVLVISVLALLPSHNWLSLGSVCGLIGVAGFLYSTRIFYRLLRSQYEIDWLDRSLYTVMPALGYAVVVAAAALLREQSEWGLDLVGAGLVVLLLAALRNAWDIMIRITLKVPSQDEAPKKEELPPAK